MLHKNIFHLILQGCQRDTPLNDNGREQAAALQQSKRLPSNVEVYSSPMKRALETCQIVTLRDHDDIILDDRLVERNFGQWTGKLKTDCLKRLESIGVDIMEQGSAICFTVKLLLYYLGYKNIKVNGQGQDLVVKIEY